MAKAFINDENLTDIADAIRATLDESRQYLPSEMAAAIDSIPTMVQLNRKKYFQSVPAGAASGYATIEQVKGNTVAWNQLANPFLSGTYDTVVITNDGNGTITLNGTASASNTKLVSYIYTFQSGHLYYISGITNGSAATYWLSCVGSLNPSSARLWTEPTIYTFDSPNPPNRLYIGYRSGMQFNNLAITPQVVDLTAIFGAGNEPTTVADFEAWMAQNGLPSVADYNAGELLSVKMSGMQTEDSSQQTLDTIALDVTTITGVNSATNVRETIFPQGMKQADRAGTVKDTLDLLSDTATVSVGSRAYQSGDESDTSVITDGTTTYYALTTPIEYTDLQDGNGNPLNPRYKVEQGGTEQVLPVNTSTPTTVAPTLSTIYKKNA